MSIVSYTQVIIPLSLLFFMQILLDPEIIIIVSKRTSQDRLAGFLQSQLKLCQYKENVREELKFSINSPSHFFSRLRIQIESVT